MIDETLKIEEFQLITDKFTELNIYFLDKIYKTKDISKHDKETFKDISSRFSLKMYEYIKTTIDVNRDELKSAVDFQIEKFEDNIKNS